MVQPQTAADAYNAIWMDGFAAGMLLMVLILGLCCATWVTATKHVRNLIDAGTDLKAYYASAAERERQERQA